MNTLALFDIDGTLTKGLAQHHAAFVTALRQVYGIRDLNLSWRNTRAWRKHSGKSDARILLDIAKKHRVKRAETMLHAAKMVMIDYYLRDGRKGRVEALPGVRKLLAKLTKKNVSLAVITGNLEPIARKKLKQARLNHFFPVGAFGDQALSRAAMLNRAIKGAGRYYKKKFGKGNIYVFGDTFRDVNSAKLDHVKAIGVATGSFSTQTLKRQKPFATLQSLEDTNKVLRVMGQDG